MQENMASKYETQDEEEEPKGPIAGIAVRSCVPRHANYQN